MKHPGMAKTIGLILAGLTVMTYGSGLRAVAQSRFPVDESGVEVLTRGPVHEAFAEPNSYNAIQGVLITRVPPSAIEEIPPDEKPAGNSVSWIPGYWNWDSERSDFIWVSGIWRVPPPTRSW